MCSTICSVFMFDSIVPTIWFDENSKITIHTGLLMFDKAWNICTRQCHAMYTGECGTVTSSTTSWDGRGNANVHFLFENYSDSICIQLSKKIHYSHRSTVVPRYCLSSESVLLNSRCTASPCFLFSPYNFQSNGGRTSHDEVWTVKLKFLCLHTSWLLPFI